MIWSVKNGNPKIGETNTNAPHVFKDKVITGISGGEFGVRGRLLAYDASNFGVFGDGSKQLVVLWDSWDWGAGTSFTHPKFNRPVAWNGKMFVPTYDGRVDVYGLA